MIYRVPKFVVISAGFAIALSLCPQPLSAQETTEQGASAQSDSASAARYRRVLDRYCVTCHNEALNTANFRLDNVNLANIADHGEVWEKVVLKLRTGGMPVPRK